MNLRVSHRLLFRCIFVLFLAVLLVPSTGCGNGSSTGAASGSGGKKKSASAKSASAKNASAREKSAGEKSAGEMSAGEKSAGEKSAGEMSAGEMSAGEKKYGKPTWLKVDSSKFPKLSELETNLEGGSIAVYDPEGWDRMPPGKSPTGFKSVIRFNNETSTILMTKSREAREMPDLDRSNIEEFATAAQSSFKSPVKMVELGNIVGVYFSKAAKSSESVSKKLERRIVATSINGQLYTYELIADQGKVSPKLLNTLFAVISKTRIEGMNEAGEAEETTTMIASTTPVKQPEVRAPAVAAVLQEEAPLPEAPSPEAKEEPKVEVAASPAVPEPKEEPKVEVAAAPLPDPKPEPKKVEPKKAEKKPAKKGGETKNILNELDALLN